MSFLLDWGRVSLIFAAVLLAIFGAGYFVMAIAEWTLLPDFLSSLINEGAEAVRAFLAVSFLASLGYTWIWRNT